MADQLGPVTIGAREIYDAVLTLTAAVGELRGVLARQRDAHNVQVEKLAEHRATHTGGSPGCRSGYAPWTGVIGCWRWRRWCSPAAGAESPTRWCRLR